jgi:hypothetical protein
MKININPNLDLIASTYLQCPDKYIWDESSISRFQTYVTLVETCHTNVYYSYVLLTFLPVFSLMTILLSQIIID